VSVTFSPRELRDLAAAWIALGVAFAIFFTGGGLRGLDRLLGAGLVGPLLVSLLTAGVGFLLHELGHKVAAVRYGQVAEFRADYGMLFLAVMSALLGFIFAAPGAVHHRGRLTEHERGLIALAGPVTNLALAGAFLLVSAAGAALDAGFVAFVGLRGVGINVFLGAFNMIPFGALDGRTVLDWSTPAFLAVFLPSAALGVVVIVRGVGF